MICQGVESCGAAALWTKYWMRRHFFQEPVRHQDFFSTVVWAGHLHVSEDEGIDACRRLDGTLDGGSITRADVLGQRG